MCGCKGGAAATASLRRTLEQEVTMTIQDRIAALPEETRSKEYIYVTYTGPSRLPLPSIGRGLLNALGAANYGPVSTGKKMYVHNDDYAVLEKRKWVLREVAPLVVVSSQAEVPPPDETGGDLTSEEKSGELPEVPKSGGSADHTSETNAP